MPLPLVAGALGLAVEAVPQIVKWIAGDDSKAAQVAEEAAGVARAITGEDSDEAAVAAIRSDPALYAKFQADMKDKAIELYRAETDRLVAEQGTVDAETLRSLPKEAAGRVALLRMTTRPKIALRMSHVILLPIYVMVVDGALALFNIVSRGFGGDGAVQLDMLGAQFFTAGSLYVELYTWAAPTAASVVLGYMGLREVGKAAGNPDNPMARVVKAATGLIGKVRGR